MKKVLFLIMLLAGSFVGIQAQQGVYIETPRAENKFINGPPNTTRTYNLRQKTGGTGTILFSLTSNGTYTSTLQFNIVTNGVGDGNTTFYVKGTALGTATAEISLQTNPNSWSDWQSYKIVTGQFGCIQ